MTIQRTPFVDNFFDFAREEIAATFNHEVTINRKSLQKFGRNVSVGTSEVEINSLNRNEVYQTANTIDSISSSNASDTQVVTYEGMTRDGNEYTFVRDAVTLQGQTKVALPTPVAVCTRAYISDESSLAGDVYIYRDTTISGGVPADLSFAHNQIPVGDNQSLRAGTSVAKNNYLVLVMLGLLLIKRLRLQ